MPVNICLSQCVAATMFIGLTCVCTSQCLQTANVTDQSSAELPLSFLLLKNSIFHRVISFWKSDPVLGVASLTLFVIGFGFKIVNREFFPRSTWAGRCKPHFACSIHSPRSVVPLCVRYLFQFKWFRSEVPLPVRAGAGRKLFQIHNRESTICSAEGTVFVMLVVGFLDSCALGV